jgi:hypothetical protein
MMQQGCIFEEFALPGPKTVQSGITRAIKQR